MKKVLFALLLALQSLVASQALAAPCAASTFGAYQALGGAGCSLGHLTFSDFTLLGEPTVSTPFTTITLAPQVTGSLAGFVFSLLPNTASGNDVFENLIAYRVTTSGALVNLASLDLMAAVVGLGNVTNTQNLCLGGAFLGVDGVSGCSGAVVDQIAIELDGFSDPSQSATFLPVSSLAVVTDIAVDGGGDSQGMASIASTSNLFQAAAVPEPESLALLLVGLFAIIATRSSRLRQGVA